MRYGLWIGVTLAVIAIGFMEWPKMRRKPPQDRAAFICLLLLGWGMSALNLPHTPGPTQLLMAVFKPLAWLVEP